MIRVSTLAQVLSLCAIAQAMSSSLMADIKEAHVQAPLKSNKVKRAQEFIMFGNQQNRASSAFGNSKSEKRASPLDGNSVVEDEEPARTFVPSEEDRTYDSNQLSSIDQSIYPHMIRDLYYGLLLRNMDLGQSLPRESAYMDLPPLYSYTEDRPKRDTKEQKPSSSKTKPTSLTKEKPTQQKSPIKGSDRTKRDSLSQDLVTLIKLMEAEKANREYQDPRSLYRYYGDEIGPRDDFNELLEPLDDDAGQWYEPPAPAHHVNRERDAIWPRPPPHKRFIVSKWRFDDAPLNGPDSLYNYYDGAQSRRRFLI